MNLEHALQVTGPPSGLVERLHAVESWADWMPGLHSVAIEGPHEVDTTWRVARNLRCRLEIDRVEGGLDYELIEGDLVEARGQLRVASADGAVTLRWNHVLRFPDPIPGTLRRELARTGTRLLRAWATAAQPAEDSAAEDSEA